MNEEVNLSVICPWFMSICPIMEDLPPDQRVLRVCKRFCEIDISDVPFMRGGAGCEK